MGRDGSSLPGRRHVYTPPVTPPVTPPTAARAGRPRERERGAVGGWVWDDMLPSNSSLRQSRLACSELAMVVFVWQVEIRGSEDWAQEFVFPESRGWVDTRGDGSGGWTAPCMHTAVSTGWPSQAVVGRAGHTPYLRGEQANNTHGGDIPAPVAACSTVLNM